MLTINQSKEAATVASKILHYVLYDDDPRQAERNEEQVKLIMQILNSSVDACIKPNIADFITAFAGKSNAK